MTFKIEAATRLQLTAAPAPELTDSVKEALVSEECLVSGKDGTLMVKAPLPKVVSCLNELGWKYNGLKHWFAKKGEAWGINVTPGVSAVRLTFAR